MIIGAGPCGLGAGYRLQELGHTDFTIIDQNAFVGGLATSFHDDRGFTWDLAVHVAHSHYHYVDALMDSLLPDGFYHHIRKSWVHMMDTYVPYPFQYNVRHLPDAARQDCVDGLIELREKGPPADVHSFKDWILATGGRGIADHFMLPYNRKIWTVDPSEMGYQWIGDRVPATDLDRVQRNIAEARDDVAWGPNATFQFPKQGGTGAIWNALADRIPAGHIRLNTGLISLDPVKKEAVLSDGTVERYDHLISTIPLVTLTRLCGIPDLHARASQLRHSHVYVVGVAPSFALPEYLSDKTWLYCPDKDTVFYRVTPFSLFSPAHVPDPAKHCSFLCEIAVPGGETRDREQLIDQTIHDLRTSGIVDTPRENTHTYFMDAPFGYPIPTLDRDAILGDVLPALEAMQIYSRGRFGGWKYEAANMDHTLMQGVEAVNRILRGEPEVTLPTPNIVNAGKR
jgi:protoporphyrinogen oxidase